MSMRSPVTSNNHMKLINVCEYADRRKFRHILFILMFFPNLLLYHSHLLATIQYCVYFHIIKSYLNYETQINSPMFYLLILHFDYFVSNFFF